MCYYNLKWGTYLKKHLFECKNQQIQDEIKNDKSA